MLEEFISERHENDRFGEISLFSSKFQAMPYELKKKRKRKNHNQQSRRMIANKS